MQLVSQKYTGLLFGEGRKEKNFLFALTEIDKFKFHTKKWVFNIQNTSGGGTEKILKDCVKASFGVAYHLVLCFVDIDVLKQTFPKTWKLEKNKLESKYKQIQIIWQLDNLEDEFKRVVGKVEGKHRINQLAKKQVQRFINSDLWKNFLSLIKDKEKELEKDRCQI